MRFVVAEVELSGPMARTRKGAIGLSRDEGRRWEYTHGPMARTRGGAILMSVVRLRCGRVSVTVVLKYQKRTAALLSCYNIKISLLFLA